MTIKILDVARDDLRDGYYFYEKQRTGLEHYFIENLSSDIESLKFTCGTL